MSFDPNSAVPEDSSFDPSTAAPFSGPSTRQVLKVATQTNPDDAAEVARLAKRYPAPNEVLLRNLRDVKLQEAVDNADRKLGGSPKLAEMLRKSPFVAQQAHDDIDPLMSLETFFSDLGGSTKAGVFRASRGAAGTFQAGLEFIAPVLDPLEGVTAIGGNPLRRLAEGFAMQGAAAGETAKAARPKTEGVLAGGFFSGVESLTQNLLSLPLAFAPGGQGAALGMMTAGTGGDAYQTAREKGLPMSQALPYAASQAAIEYATEKLPLARLLGDVKAGTPFAQTLAKQIALEVPGEQVATVLQDLNDWAVLNPEKPFSAYLEERPSAAAQTLVATIVGTGGNVAVVKGIEAMVNRGLRDAKEIENAERAGQGLEQALKIAAASKLRERNPETFQQLVQQMAEQTEGAPQTVFIDAQVLMQSATPEQIAQLLPSTAEQLEAAVASNGMLEVPISEALTALPGTPLEQVFLQNARANANALSLADAQQASEQAGEFLKAEADRVLSEAQDRDAWEAEADAVKAAVLADLNTAARFSPEVNDAYSIMVRDFFSVMAQRNGMTPEEMYARYPLRVSGAQPAPGGAQLDQVSPPTGALTGTDGQPLKLYHGTNAAIEKFDPDMADTGAGQSEGAVWLTSDPTVAERFGNITMPTYATPGKVFEVTPASMRELLPAFGGGLPIVVDGRMVVADINRDVFVDGQTVSAFDLLESGRAAPAMEPAIRKRAIAAAKKAGADTVVFRGFHDASDNPSDIIAVLDPKRISSALTGQTLNQTPTGAPEFQTTYTDAQGETYNIGLKQEVLGMGADRALSVIVEARTADGNRRGVVNFEVNGNTLAAGNVNVATTYQRKGLAEAMYRAAREAGYDIAPGRKQTAEGQQLVERLRAKGVINAERALEQSAGDVTQTEAFKAWFGSSKVVDDQGKPLVVYHGTRGAFTVFDYSKIGEQGRSEGAGFYFTNNSAVASGYGQLMEVYLSIQKPMAYDAKPFGKPVMQKIIKRVAELEAEVTGSDIGDGFLSNFGDVSYDGLPSVLKEATNLLSADDTALDQLSGMVGSGVSPEYVNAAVREVTGFDGVVATGFSNKGDAENTIYVAFFPEQIKSATGNDGTFDANDPSILSQQARGTFNPQTLLITLNESANLSTFLHESGHFFLEVMADLASQPNAPAQIQDDMGKLLAWFGITGNEQVGGADAGGDLAQSPLMRWFGTPGPENNMVNEDGTPMVLYHGTTKAAVKSLKAGSAFRRSKSGAMGGAVYLGDSPEASAGYDQGALIKVYARGKYLSNAKWTEYIVTHGWDKAEAAARADGYAGVYDTMFENAIAVWDPANIKAVDAKEFTEGGGLYEQDGPTTQAPPIQPQRTPLETWRAMTLDQKRPYHERFAESMEQYFMEGKAPSIELQPVFRRFRSWLLQVYKSLKAFVASRVPVTTGGASLAQAQAEGYQGNDAGEAREWLAAVAKGLDMSLEARMARAEAMGFDTSKKLYHSTLADTKEFAPFGKFMGFTGTSGISVTDSPEMASRYLDRYGDFNYKGEPFQKNVIPVFIKPGKVLERNEPFPMPPGMRLGAPLPPGYVPAHKQMGYDTLVRDDAISRKGPVKHSDAKNAIRGKEYVLTDPSQLRSIFAAFDPDNATSGNLLAQGAAPTGPAIQLNDDIRRVFDRMLATDEQIAAAEQTAGMLPDFDATNEAIEQLQARSLRDMKWMVGARNKAIKALQKQAATLRKGIEAEVREEVDAMPEFRAQRALADVRKQSRRQPNDTEMAVIAEANGYASAGEMLAVIDAVGKKADVVEGMADQRMLERHGDLVDQRAIEEAANLAVHNAARARMLATELKAQSDALNPRADTGRTNAKGSRITVNALHEAAKQFAENLTARRKLKDLKNATWQHTAAERRASKRWQEATAKGDTQGAVQAKRDQLLNNLTAKAMAEAQAEVKKIEEFFAKVTKGNDEKVVKGGRDPDVVNAMRAMLAAYGIAPRLEKAALEYMEAVRLNDPAMFNALAPGVQAATLVAKPFGELTIEELRGLHEELRAMWLLAKRSRQMEVDGNLLDLDDAADQLMARMTEIGVPDTIPGEKGAITDAQERGIKLRFFKAILSRAEQWAERMDGKFGGPFLRLVFQPIKEAADHYRTARIDYRKRFTALLENLAPAMPRGPIAAPELGYTFGSARDSGVAELLHAILHTGNDSNKRKLLLGRGWATEMPDGTLDTRMWDAFINRMHAEGRIGKEHYDFAQGVWDLLEEMKPLAQEAHRKVYGRYFAEVTANEVATPFGNYRGGYVPAQTDARIVKDAKLRELAEGENESMAYAFPSSPNGFTKARVDYNKPLLLDLRALAQHMDKVLLFSHMQPAVNDVRRLLTAKRVSYALDRIDPSAYEGMLIPWLNRAAKQIVETPVVGDRRLSRFLSAARSRAGMALMFANLSNTVQQITGFSMAAVKVKPSLMLKATAEFTRSPKALKQTVADASAYMKDRMLNENAAMIEATEQILTDPTLLERGQAWTQRHAYFMQAAVDNTMSPIIWTAAYNQAIEEGSDERDAVRFADGVVRQTQGSTLPEDISRFESGPGYARLFTQFVSYFNMMANTNATAVKQITDEMGLRKGAGKLVYVALAGLLAPIWVAELIANAFRGGPEDDEDDGYLDDWLMAVFGIGTVRGLVAQVPIVGQMVQLAVNRFNDNPADDKFSLSPAVSLIESSVSAPRTVYDAIVEDGNKAKALRDTAAAATMITGLPIYGALRPAFYLTGIADDRVEPTGPVDFARGLVTGTASPESKQ